MKINCNKNLIKFWQGWLIPILTAMLIATTFKSAIAEMNIVPTGSMIPTILEGDRILVNKLAYDLKIPYTTFHIAEWSNPQEGDIVVCYSPVDDIRLVKRVVGVPGDTIEMQDNQLIINGKKLNYEYVAQVLDTDASPGTKLDHYRYTENMICIKHSIIVTPQYPSVHRSFGPVTIPEGKYFMMGDNRDNSEDSRYFGFIDRSQIIGKATSVVISLDINHKYLPRWGRFFTSLR